eukprot:TRINITY_DN1427_c0_g1_i1.p1 TRINITY_DN1427_c0_g1~~TRINITY_DN1427_c0_g1_i1.p1  ORF type:complete len:133 (-),score=28.41 TRINITY_DN1427_c0_g1_i1:49-447(-)
MSEVRRSLRQPGSAPGSVPSPVPSPVYPTSPVDPYQAFKLEMKARKEAEKEAKKQQKHMKKSERCARKEVKAKAKKQKYASKLVSSAPGLSSPVVAGQQSPVHEQKTNHEQVVSTVTPDTLSKNNHATKEGL